MLNSVYIHIPFCRSKCHYCSFISYQKLELKNAYLEALKKEITAKYKNEDLRTLYFGGGTPSLLTGRDFDNIIQLFNISYGTEVTAELNPEGYDGEGLSLGYLKDLKQAGISRISIGAQSFNDGILKQINRRHNVYQIYKAVENAKNTGFDNISLDFIYGLPTQSVEMFLSDLEKAVELGVNHISLYGLTIDEGSYFYFNKPDNLADDEKQGQMYKSAVKFLTDKGFQHYEISNFAKGNYISKHNMNYWNNNEYYAFGTAAHGYLNNLRYSHHNTIENYIKFPLEYFEEYKEDKTSQLEEEIFLGFRKTEGININNINKKYGIDFNSKYKKFIDKYIKLKLMKETPEGYALTLDGIILSNAVLADFLE